ncbi:MAG: hypothetical protein ACP6IU_15075 [Candidatus Asgardarchaeia archaeon]
MDNENRIISTGDIASVLQSKNRVTFNDFDDDEKVRVVIHSIRGTFLSKRTMNIRELKKMLEKGEVPPQ